MASKRGKRGLTVRQIETAPPGRYSDGGAPGLILRVSPTGARLWIARVTVSGKRRELSIGNFPAVGLAEARHKAIEAQRTAKSGTDPVEERQRAARVESELPTFSQAAARYIRAHRRGWKSRKHGRQWVATLKTYARPVIGARRVDAIGTEEVLQILKPIWQTKPETAKRVQGRIEAILDYAAAHQWRDALNPARWRGHLDKLLPSAAKVKRQNNGGAARHHPAMPYIEVPGFMRELEAVEGVAALALRFLLLTATRTSEVLKAQWREIDMASATWTIPPERMKAGREHRVPLTAEALAILAGVPRVAGEQWVFPGAREGKPLSSMALLMAMRRLGYGVGGTRGDYVPHGFRSAFRDWCGEVSTFPANVAEAALAHQIGDKTVAAYARGDLFAKRRRLMEAWSSWCMKSGGEVVALDRRRVAGD